MPHYQISQSRSLPAGHVFHARLILMLAQSSSSSVIQERLQTTARTTALETMLPGTRVGGAGYLSSRSESQGPHSGLAGDIIGLCLNPPQQTAIFFADETSAIQALDRKGPVLRSLRAALSAMALRNYRDGTPLSSIPGPAAYTAKTRLPTPAWNS